jgi:hypothetical protein
MSAHTPLLVSETAYRRFRRLLPARHNPELIVLKGHLLVEAELTAFLAAASRHPDQLNDARLSFVQKTCLVRAFGRLPPKDSLSCSLFSSTSSEIGWRIDLSPETLKLKLTPFFGSTGPKSSSYQTRLGSGQRGFAKRWLSLSP